MEIPCLFYYELGSIIYCLLNIPHLNMKEQNVLINTIQHQFKDDLISFNQVVYPGITQTITRKNFYDFVNKEFFYTPSLFEQYLLFTRNLFGQELPLLEETKWDLKERKLFKKYNLNDLIEEVNSNRDEEHLQYKDLTKIVDTIEDLESSFIDKEKWSSFKKREVYSKYVDSLRFKPIFSRFGMQEFYVYFRPIKLTGFSTDFREKSDFKNNIDFELILLNTFKSLKYSEISKSSYIFLIKYIFPYGNPNLAYLNWLLLSKKNISEYCIFSIKKTHDQYDFEKNIDFDGDELIWNLEISRFITYVQEILFEKQGLKPKRNYKTTQILKRNQSEIYTPQSPEFKDLVSVYPQNARNLKNLGNLPKDEELYQKIRSLIKKNLGLLKMKTSKLKLHQKIIIIIPSIEESAIQPILEIFQFFNKVQINEIEGEYYLHSFLKTRSFERGLYIKVWFPDIDISDFIEYFSHIFKYFKLPHVLLITNLLDGTSFLNQLFKDIDLENDYNPLINLKWNPIDKIWMNHKKFNEKFEPIYPPLVSEPDDDAIFDNSK